VSRQSLFSVPTPGKAPARETVLRRKCACGQHAEGGECEECRKKKGLLQRRQGTGPEPSGAPAIVHETLRSPGEPLDRRARDLLEPRLGQDFSGVRVHTDAGAAASARSVNALAYTVGERMVFAAGQYSPHTAAGQKLLAHELTHVAQQRSLGGGYPLQALRIGGENDVYERQAEELADAVAAGGRTPAPPLAMRAPAVQRLGAGDQFLRFFGIESGEFSDPDLTEYLDRVAKRRRCDCGTFDFLSDDMAREIINRWGVGKHKLDQDYGDVPSVEIKRILVEELLAGPTGDNDEKAIIKVFKDSQPKDVERLLDPAHGLDIRRLVEDINGENQAVFLRVLEQKMPNAGGAYLGLHTTFTGCSDEWKTAMTDAARTAEIWVSDAVAQLNSALADPKNAGSRLRDNLRRHFKTDPSATEVVKEIRDTLAEIQVAFVGDIPFECKSDCKDGVPAETGGLLGLFPRGNLKLCPAWLRQKPWRRAEIVLHEMAHRFAGKSGFSELYMDRDFDQYMAQSTSSSLSNADSFAEFARMLQEPTGDAPPAEPEKKAPDMKGKP
jgi:hypothetical protein